jgi:hypothetical protein
MRARILTVLGTLAAGSVVSCTIFASVSLSGLESDGGTVNNGCRNLLTTVNACGACMEQQAGGYANQLCTQNKYARTLSDMEACAKEPAVDNYECNTFFPASDASISTATTPEALASNIEVQIGNNCEAQCQYVFLTYSGCSSKTVQLATATTCGTCITNNCRAELVKAKRGGGISSAPLVACGRSGNDCVGAPDCSQIKYKPDAGYSNEMKAVLDCVATQCTGVCPGL